MKQGGRSIFAIVAMFMFGPALKRYSVIKCNCMLCFSKVLLWYGIGNPQMGRVTQLVVTANPMVKWLDVSLSGERTSLLLPIFIIQMKMEVLRLL